MSLLAIYETTGSHEGCPYIFGELTGLPDRNDRVKENVAGAYYVDSSCIDCDVCRDTAPENFQRSDANSYSFVFKQPLSEEERAACEEALTCCPVEAIGNDGE